MKLFQLLILTAIIFVSCSKNNKENEDTAKSGDCKGRYEKELFPSLKTTLDIQYGSAMNTAGLRESLLMDLYEPNDDTARQRAMLIFVHGGGWTSGTKNQGREFCTFFAKRGYVAASIDYRLNIDNPLNEKTRGEAVYRGVQDIKAAIRFARANAALYKIDINQIVIGGYSAGAVNAVHAAYWNENEVPANIDKARWGSLEGSGGSPNFPSDVKAVFGIASAIVDLNWIQYGEAPIICVSSKTDRTIPYGAATDGLGIVVYGGAAIVPKASSVNVPAALYTYENIAHGEYLQPPNFSTTVGAVQHFLASHVTCQ